MKKIVIVAGTRPEVIKMAPVVFELRKSKVLDPFFLTTAQHRQMLDQTLGAFGIRSDQDLDLMQEGQGLANLTAKMIPAVASILKGLNPDAVLVQGDTTTVFSTAIAAFYERIPIGHIEAGLRTYDMTAPFPEEMNRRLVDPISKWCFAPTASSAENLLRENIPSEKIHITGNTVVDAMIWMIDQIKTKGVKEVEMIKKCKIPEKFFQNFLVKSELEEQRSRFILITGHRRESFGGGFERICDAIRILAEKYPEIGFLYPVHLNPNVQEPVRRILKNLENVALIDPVSYSEFVWLMNSCYFVISDSGGIQEEAPGLGKPVLILRDTTERPEGVEAGTCILVGTDPDKIVNEASLLIEDTEEYVRRSCLKNPYGDGSAARKIRKILEESI